MTVQIPHDIEMKIYEKVSGGDTNAVHYLLLDIPIPKIVETWINKNAPSTLSNEEFKVLSDQLADKVMDYVGPNLPPLLDYAVSREGIYDAFP